MLKKALCAVLALLAALSLSACASIYEDEYYYTEEYSEDDSTFDLSGTNIRNYVSLRGAVSKLVNSHGTHARLIFSNYAGNLNEDLAAVCYEVQSNTPLGVYAVENLRYEMSRFVTYYAADIYVTYCRSAEELAEVRSITGEEALKSVIENGIIDCSGKLVFRYYSPKADTAEVEQFIKTTLETTPLLTVSYPNVEVISYPESGLNRIYEVTFTYEHSKTQINTMRSVLRTRANEIAAGFTQEAAWARTVACAEFISQNCAVDENSGANTAYDALVLNSASPEGIAEAYAALCSLMNIKCYVVEGTLGIGSNARHFWNIVKIDDDYYHIDASRIWELGTEKCVLLEDGDIWGEYLWDPNDYPTCSGELDYAALYTVQETSENKN